MPSSISAGHLSFIALLLLLFISAARATDHIVGGNRGWNPGMNYTLWANNHTFYVGDLIYLRDLSRPFSVAAFRYQKNMYNVYRVNESGYVNCTTDGAYGNWSSGKDFISLDHAKWYYFICGPTYLCQQGMKVAVHVLPLTSPPQSAEDAAGKSKSAGPPVASGRGAAVLLGLLVGWIWGV
ncbi:hypothetical protein ACLOJK_002652 [Asimina triloba]